MSTHTSGPWIVEPSRHDRRGAIEIVAAYSYDPVSGAHTTTVIATCDRQDMVDENDANARLIASAPELLAALKEYVEWFGAVHGEQCPADDTCTCIGGGLNARVSVAISKAEGRS